jgi:hypothetical protein
VTGEESLAQIVLLLLLWKVVNSFMDWCQKSDHQRNFIYLYQFHLIEPYIRLAFLSLSKATAYTAQSDQIGISYLLNGFTTLPRLPVMPSPVGSLKQESMTCF